MRDMEHKSETIMQIFLQDVADIGRQEHHRKSKIVDIVFCVTLLSKLPWEPGKQCNPSPSISILDYAEDY